MFQFWEEYPIFKSVKLSSAEVKLKKILNFAKIIKKKKKKSQKQKILQNSN